MAGDGEPSADVVAQVSQEIYSAHLLPSIVSALSKVDFEVWDAHAM